MARGRNGNGNGGGGKSGPGGKNKGDVYKGTDGNDTFLGGDADEKMVGSAGDDIFQGGGGIDTADYSKLDTAITFKTAGIIEKEGLGTDTLGSFDVEAGTIDVVEVVVGPKGQPNLIDATSVVGIVDVDINLAEETATSTVVSPLGGLNVGDSFSLSVVNFVNVNGTNNDDRITGDEASNIIAGAGGNDELAGGGGDDIFVFDQEDGGVDTVSDFSDGDVLLLENGFGAFDGTELGFDDVFGASGDGNAITVGDDTITSELTADGLSVSFNGEQFVVVQEDMLIA